MKYTLEWYCFENIVWLCKRWFVYPVKVKSVCPDYPEPGKEFRIGINLNLQHSKFWKWNLCILNCLRNSTYSRPIKEMWCEIPVEGIQTQEHNKYANNLKVMNVQPRMIKGSRHVIFHNLSPQIQCGLCELLLLQAGCDNTWTFTVI